YLSVAPGSQEKYGCKSLLKIDLRRELDPPKFSKKPENVAFRSISRMQSGPHSGSLQEGRSKHWPCRKPTQRQAWPAGIRHGSTPGSWRVTRAGWLGSSWQQLASPQRASLGSGGVALRASTPATPKWSVSQITSWFRRTFNRRRWTPKKSRQGKDAAMPGPRPALCTFPEDFLQEALDTVSRRTVVVQTVQRFRLVLLLHEQPSLGNDEAAEAVGLSARQVQRWRSRWATGDFCIEDHSGRGRKAAFSPSGSSVDPSDGL